MLSVLSTFVINLGFPVCILRPVCKLSSVTVFDWCSISLTPSVVRATSSANIRSDSFSPSIFIPFSSSWAFLKTSWTVALNDLGENCVSLPHASQVWYFLWDLIINMHSCNCSCVDIFRNSNTSFNYAYCSQCLKYCFMFYRVKCLFIVNVTDAKRSIEFIHFSISWFDCLKMISCRVNWPVLETAIFVCRHTFPNTYLLPSSLCNVRASENFTALNCK